MRERQHEAKLAARMLGSARGMQGEPAAVSLNEVAADEKAQA
jgi:hypothetical protein